MLHRSVKYILAPLLVTLATSLSVDAQINNNRQGYDPRYYDEMGMPLTESARMLRQMQEENAENPDSTVKPPRIRKPLESFYFDDSTRRERIFAWGVSLYNNDIHRKDVDTLLSGFNIDYSFMREDVGGAYLGNLGGATIPLNYFRRPDPPNFSFLRAWSTYIMTPEGLTFYNAKMPYSRLSYAFSGQRKIEESLFNAILSHNISPSSSFGLEYNADGTRGMYQRQRALSRYFSANFAHTGKRYAVHAGYIYNKGDINENGGITDDRNVTDTIFPLPNSIPVNLMQAKNLYRGNTFFVTQSYGIPLRKQREDELTIQEIPSIFIGQTILYSRFNKTFTASGTQDMAFFQSHYIDPLTTHDSISQSLLDLRFFAQIQPYNREGILGVITAGAGNENSNYFYYIPDNFKGLFGPGGKQGKNSTYLYGTVDGKISRYAAWDASLKYYMLGYRNQDFDFRGHLRLSAFMKDKPLTLDAAVQFTLREPDFWLQNYFSNHYAWSNSFSKETATLVSAKFTVPSWGLELGADYTMTKDKIYYDQWSMPRQSGSMLNVMGLYLQKNFRLGGFHFNHRVLTQWSSDQQVAPVPEISAFLSYFYQFHVVHGVLELALGIDARYNTKYYAFAWNPAIGQFYNQREKELGDYPYIDAFVTAKWKRMRIRVKTQHLNAHLTGNRNYFTVLHHPVNRFMLKLGFSWSFYD